MGTVFRLVFYTEKDSTVAKNIARQVFDRVDTLNAVFSDYLPESELNRLSDKAGSGKKIKVSEDLWHILCLSKKYAKASKGAFDPTVGALTRLWRRARHLKEAPDSARVAAALKTVDYRSIRFFKNRQIQLKRKGTRLDLGGIAQGYAADECLARLREAGILAALADAGGDIALGDAPPGYKGWTVERITSDSTKEVLVLANCGITTSGALYRFFEAANGVRYSHIINPQTGWGITKHHLVTVLALNAVAADAWATALSVTGKSTRKKWQKRPARTRVWITPFNP
ncbi:MAG: FAD:protein FMN transferase [Saprospiraceae bacterium]|nr:FAD:protein FMN transferase [Saprospiraceae bacterium]